MLVVIFNPLIVTVMAVVAAWYIFPYLKPFLKRHKRIVQAVLVISAGIVAIDFARAVGRYRYAQSLASGPVVNSCLPIPKRLIFVADSPQKCGALCHQLLLSGKIETLIVPAPYSWRRGKSTAEYVSYKISKTKLGTCPEERFEMVEYNIREDLRAKGICPVVELADLPETGVFIVRDFFRVSTSQPSKYFRSKTLKISPSGLAILFEGLEVQERTMTNPTIVHGHVRRYHAPSFLGPLVGCWARPDNIIWIMPPGDAGCGFWRMMTGGGYSDANHIWHVDSVIRTFFQVPD